MISRAPKKLHGLQKSLITFTKLINMRRKHFIANSALVVIGYNFFSKNLQQFVAGETPDLFALNEVTIDQLQAFMKNGKYTSEQITKMYLDRIAAIDKKGPALNSVIEVNPDAIMLARKADDERRKGKWRGSMHGIPVLIKDNIDSADKMMTTAGALALTGNHASKDAFIVTQLREAGAVLLGKTNLSEWANFRSSRSVSGWSSRGGQTKNPYELDRNPCGSSSGSAVAVSANLCAVAIGTETNGSINCPASINGIVGIKPTVGLLSRSGIIPISKTQDTAGPLARTVRDAAIFLGVLAGKDANDIATSSNPNDQRKDYTQYLDSNGLNGKKIGVEKSFITGGHEAIASLFKKAMDQMTAKGATIVEVDFLTSFRKLGIDSQKVLQYEFKDGVNNYLASANAPVKTLADVIQYNKDHEAKAMPYFKQETLEASQARGSITDKEYMDALAKYDDARKFFTKFFEDNKLDAICGPSNGFPWCIDWINGDHYTGYGLYGPAAVCGFPSMNVPMGSYDDLPVGLAFMATAYKEPELITIAYAYEQATKNRIVPKFKKGLS
jgi:amidase